MAANKDTGGITHVYTHSLTWIFKWMFWSSISLCLSWALAVGLAWAFQTYVWDGDAQLARMHFERAFAVLLNDASAASFMAAKQAIGGARLIFESSAFAYRWVFVETGFETVYFQAMHGVEPAGLDRILFNLIRENSDVVQAAMWGTKLFGAKLALVLTSLPLFLAAYLVAMVDGLVMRYIRTVGGGRESSFLYHRSKYMSVMLVGTGLTIVLLLPIEFRATWILPLMALCTGMLARIQWKYFKKYL